MFDLKEIDLVWYNEGDIQSRQMAKKRQNLPFVTGWGSRVAVDENTSCVADDDDTSHVTVDDGTSTLHRMKVKHNSKPNNFSAHLWVPSEHLNA